MGLCVLTRKLNEKIEVVAPDGSVITIIPIQVKGKRIRIGVKAPQDYDIRRVEDSNMPSDDDEGQTNLPEDAHLKTFTGLDVSSSS